MNNKRRQRTSPGLLSIESICKTVQTWLLQSNCRNELTSGLFTLLGREKRLDTSLRHPQKHEVESAEMESWKESRVITIVPASFDLQVLDHVED